MQRHILRRLGSDAIVYGAAIAVQRALAFLLLPLYTRALVPADYAGLDLLLSLLSVLNVVFVLGMDSSTVILAANAEENRRRALLSSGLTVQLLWGSVLTAAVFALRPLLVVVLRNSFVSEDMLWLLAINIPLQGLTTFSTSLLRWEQRTAPFLLVTILQTAATAALTAVFLPHLGLGLRGALLAIAVANGFAAALSICFLLPLLGTPPQVRMMRQIVCVGGPMAASSLLNTAQAFIQRSLLIAILGFASAGIFAAGSKFAAAVILMSQAFGMAWGPILLRAGPKEVDRLVMSQVARAFAGSLAIAGAILVLFGFMALSVLIGGAFAGAFTVVGPLTLSYCILGWRNEAVSFGFYLAQETRHLPLFNLVGIAAVVMCLPPIAWLWGVVGAAWALAACEAIVTASMLVTLERVFPVPHAVKASIWLCISYSMVILADRIIGAAPMAWPFDIAARSTIFCGFLVSVVGIGIVRPGELFRMRDVLAKALGR